MVVGGAKYLFWHTSFAATLWLVELITLELTTGLSLKVYHLLLKIIFHMD